MSNKSLLNDLYVIYQFSMFIKLGSIRIGLSKTQSSVQIMQKKKAGSKVLYETRR